MSPRLYSRIDVAKYKNGLKTGLNATCLPHGPCKRRNGTKYRAEVKDSTKTIKMLRFQFNQDNAYILEFGNLYIRFFKSSGQILSSAAITNGTFTTDLTGWTDDDTGTGASTQSSGKMRLNGGAAGSAIRTQAVSNFSRVTSVLSFTVATNTCTYKVGTTYGGTEIASGTGSIGSNSVNIAPTANNQTLYIQFINSVNNNSDVDNVSLTAPIYEITTTYTEAELTELTYVQFGTTIYICHKDHAPAKLVWTSDAVWTLSDIFFYPPATDEEGFKPAATLTPSAATGTSVNFTAGSGVFLAGDVGRQIHNLSGAGKASIISYTSATVVVCDILENFPSTSAIASQSWKMDLSPIAKLSTDQTSIGVTATINSFYTDSTRGAPKTITNITAASPGVITSTGHGLVVGDKVEIKNIVGMTFLNNKIWVVGTVPTADTLTLKDASAVAVDTTTYGAYANGGTLKKVFADVGLDVFRSADIGKFLVFNGGIGEVTAVTSAQAIKVELQKSMTSASDSSIWSIEEEAWNSTNGYPRTVALHQQRLWFGGTDNSPQTIVGSESGIFDSIAVGAEPSDAVEFDISTSEVNEIQWMYGLRSELVIGTSGAELTVDSGQVAGPITPDSIVQESRSYNGSNLQQPIPLESEVLYIQRSGMKINSFRYSFEADNYISDDLIFLAEHLPRNAGGIKEIAYAQDPDRLIYAVLNDGTMAVGTYYRDQQVIAWTLYDTDGEFENAQTISTGPNDEVWVCVKRTINGSTKRYIETFDVSTGEDNIDGFSDCYLTYSQPKTITGITKANPGVVTANGHGFSNGDRIKIIDVEGMTEVNGHTFLVANVTTNTFELQNTSSVNVNTSSYEDYESGGEAHKLITSVSGLSHLEGCTVQVKADGASHTDKVVSSGAITLDSYAYEVTVGLSYHTEISTLNREFTIGLGSEQAQPQRLVRPVLRVYKSIYPTLNGEFVPARTPSDNMDSKVPLFTGDIEYGNLSWDTSASLIIETSEPFPLVISGIFGSIEAGVR